MVLKFFDVATGGRLGESSFQLEFLLASSQLTPGMMVNLNRAIMALNVFIVANFVKSHGITSLYVPGFDENAPLSASVLGVDGDGRTTWALFKGQPEATDTSSYGDFGTATLVEGSDAAFLTYSNAAGHLTIAESCTITQSTLAVCKIVAQGSTATQTEAISYVPVQVGATSSDPVHSTFTSTSTSSKARTSASASSLSAAPVSSDVIPSRTESPSIPTTSSSLPRFRGLFLSRYIITLQVSMLVLFLSMS